MRIPYRLDKTKKSNTYNIKAESEIQISVTVCGKLNISIYFYGNTENAIVCKNA